MDNFLTITQKLEAANVVYPMNWEEMSSSAKDMWEERRYNSLVRFGK